MATQTQLTEEMMNEYPANVVGEIIRLLGEHPDTMEYDADIYVGEFFNEKDAKRLARKARQKPVFQIGLEDITRWDNGKDRTTDDGLTFPVYAVCASRRDEKEEIMLSYVLANRARRALVGKRLESLVNDTGDKETNEGVLIDEGITREFINQELSVYAANISIDLRHDLDK